LQAALGSEHRPARARIQVVFTLAGRPAAAPGPGGPLGPARVHAPAPPRRGGQRGEPGMCGGGQAPAVSGHRESAPRTGPRPRASSRGRRVQAGSEAQAGTIRARHARARWLAGAGLVVAAAAPGAEWKTPSRMPRALTEGPVGGGDSGSPPRRGGGGQITVKYEVLCTREQNWTSKRARLKIDPSSHLP
jgi:hypothetical protein